MQTYTGKGATLKRHLYVLNPDSCTLCSSSVWVTMLSWPYSHSTSERSPFVPVTYGLLQKGNLHMYPRDQLQQSPNDALFWVPRKQEPIRYPGKSLLTQLKDAFLRSRYTTQRESCCLAWTWAAVFGPKSSYQDWVHRKWGKPVLL